MRKKIGEGCVVAVDGKTVTFLLPRELLEHPAFAYKEGETLRLRWDEEQENWVLERPRRRARSSKRGGDTARN